MPAEPSAPLAIVGNLNVDLWIQTVDRFPRWDEELLVDSARLELAGTAGYILLACKGLGIDAFTVSTIGDDAFGRYLQQSVEDLGFSTQGVDVLPGEQTSLGMIFIGEDGRRSILSTLGAHEHMDVAVARRHEAAIAGCHEVFLCGSYLLPRMSPSYVHEYARGVRARGQTVVFDPSWDPSGWGDETRESTYELLREVDVYMPNEEELTHLTGVADWRDALRAVVELPGEIVLKRGARGAVHARGGEWTEVPAFAIEAVSTIGAGDVFDTGYLYGRRRGWPPRRRLEFACALAASVVSQRGTRVYPDAAGVRSFLQEHGEYAGWMD